MEVVLDTHAWLWHWATTRGLTVAAEKAMARAGALIVPAISCWEVAMLVLERRVELDLPIDEWFERALAEPRYELCPITPDIAIDSASYGRSRLHGDPCDRLIVATARMLKCPLISGDSRIHDSGLVQCIW
ncbi:MAG: type II toxin-antitoxin system VapC family toxin [Planctomycetes bacterium]|nr:type II toxin-antitoxin system VapC family toxin [Planctomycetota bacterium]